ncbi:MAG: glycosyltransferase, partial [Firmicutes bacterium]|nr:glycosyltransferase [Bacillota bacterium]
MRVIVTGGGTGGHIYPAIAIADKFKEMDPQTEILYVGNDEGIEKEIVPKTGYPLELVDAR